MPEVDAESGRRPRWHVDRRSPAALPAVTRCARACWPAVQWHAAEPPR